VLWIKGKPGAGKSTLMKHALHHYEDIFATHLIAAYFFHARGDMLEKTPLGMLRSIVFQLVDKDDTLYKHFLPIFREKRYSDGGSNENGNGNRRWQWQWQQPQLEDFLVSVVKRRRTQRPLLLLVDALDECTDGDVREVVEFLELLSIHAVAAGTTLRICLSSRHYPHVSIKSNLELTVDGTAGHCQDIATYVGKRLRVCDNEIKAEVQKRAGGIFMWVAIVISLLNKAKDDGKKVDAMRRTLETVPDDLEKLFDNLLSQDDASRAETIVLLQWVLLSRRPLLLEELYFGVIAATDPESIGRWDRRKVTRDTMQYYITRLSKGLVEVRKGDQDNNTDNYTHDDMDDYTYNDMDNYTYDDMDDYTQDDMDDYTHDDMDDYTQDDMDQERVSVQFIHQSVNDFLLRNQRLQKLDTTLTSDPIRVSHDRLWACCWQYVKYVGTVLTSKEYIRQFHRDYPFLLYAAKYIFDHAEKALTEEATETTIQGDTKWQAISDWLQAQNGWFEWWKIFVETSETDLDLDEHMDAGLLYIISLRGYRSLVRMVLVEKRINTHVNVVAGKYGTALQAASYMGQPDIVRMLREAGANVNAEAGQFGTALQAASFEGHADIVRMLLDAGANVNTEAGHYGTALQAASCMGHADIVRMLLDAGADVNIKAGECGTALQAASDSGHPDIVRMLLEARADVNIAAGVFGTALQAASIEGHAYIVRMLLDASALVNTVAGLYGTALQAASASLSGNADIVCMLLDASAHVNIAAGYYGTALQAASFRGQPDIVRMLLDAGGVFVNTEAGYYGTALQAASASLSAKPDIVRMLLEAGANVNIEAGYYGTALHAASFNGYADIVRMLLEAGANVHIEARIYGTALQAASVNGRANVMRMLRAAGAVPARET